MKAVILESYVMEEGDLDWSGVKALVPDTVSYVRTAYEEIAPRIGDADIVLLNKCRMDEEILQQCPNLKWVGIIATGTDNLDLEACRRHGVAVANVPGYSTYSVAQMTFSLLLAICQCAERYNRAVKQGCWQLDIPESIGLLPQMELYGKTYGVYGYGSIGRQSARIARASETAPDAAHGHQHLPQGVVVQVHPALQISADLRPQLFQACVGGVAGAAMLQALDACFPHSPRCFEIRLAHAQTDALGHISGQIEEFADAGGAHLPCGRRDQFIVIHHRTVHSLSSISSS